MSDPIRWTEPGSDAPDGAAELLRAAMRPPPMPASTRSDFARWAGGLARRGRRGPARLWWLALAPAGAGALLLALFAAGGTSWLMGALEDAFGHHGRASHGEVIHRDPGQADASGDAAIDAPEEPAAGRGVGSHGGPPAIEGSASRDRAARIGSPPELAPSELLAWYCVGFVAVFLVGLVFLVTALMGLGHEGALDPGHHDAELGGSEAAADHDADTAPESDGHSGVLDFLGVGRCPLSIVLMSLCFFFSLIGMATVMILRLVAPPGPVIGLVAYPVASVGTVLLTRAMARTIGKHLPSFETYVEAEAHHIGSMGTAVYAFEGGKGFIQVKDRTGTVHELSATCREPEAPIAAGASVLVVDYDEGARTFGVQPVPVDVENH